MKQHQKECESGDEAEAEIEEEEITDISPSETPSSTTITRRDQFTPFNKHCRICGKCFPTPIRMQRHLWTHDASQLPYRCALCSRAFRDRYYLQEHERAHRCCDMVVCGKCGGAFKSRGTLSRHARLCEGSGVESAVVIPAADPGAGVTDPDVTVKEEGGVEEEKGDDEAKGRRLRRRNSSHNFLSAVDNDIDFTDNNTDTPIDNGDFYDENGVTETSPKPLDKLSASLSSRSRQCSVCRRVFSHHGALRVHMRIHTGERPYRCLLCLRRFVQRPHLVRHFETNHHPENPFSCLVCGRGFVQQQLLDFHCRTKHPVTSVDQLLDFDAESADPDSITDQSVEILSRADLVADPIASYECDQCNRSFSVMSSLRKHVKYCLANRQKNRLKAAKKDADIADAAESRLLLKNEQEEDEENHQDENSSPTLVKPSSTAAVASSSCRCFICGRRFSTLLKLIAHRRVHMTSSGAGPQGNLSVPPTTQTTRRRQFKCPICQKTFHWRSNLGRHMRLHQARGETGASRGTVTHVPPGEKDGNLQAVTIVPVAAKVGERGNRCSICCRSFVTRKALMIHSFYCSRAGRTASSDHVTISAADLSASRTSAVSASAITTGHKCHICGKLFARRGKLQRHLKTHSAQKPYSCELCGHGFTERCNLVQHMQLHEVSGPCKCPHCGRCFNQRRNLATHVRKIHHRVLLPDEGDNRQDGEVEGEDSGTELFEQGEE